MQDASNTASPLYLPWQTVSALASETGQAVRQTFSDSGIGTSGHVQHGLQYHVSSSKPSEHLSQLQASFVDNCQADCKVEDTSAAAVLDREAVQADVSRVKTKMASTNAATEVILRFNFMGARESKVRHCCQGSEFTRDLWCAVTTPCVQVALLCLAASIMVGAAVLVTEFVKKMQEVAQCFPAAFGCLSFVHSCCPMTLTHRSVLLRDTVLLQFPDAKSYACGALLLAALVG